MSTRRYEPREMVEFLRLLDAELALEDVHRSHAFDLETLIARFFDTRTQVTGSLELFKLSFLALVERIFGGRVARDVERRLKKGPAGAGGGV